MPPRNGERQRKVDRIKDRIKSHRISNNEVWQHTDTSQATPDKQDNKLALQTIRWTKHRSQASIFMRRCNRAQNRQQRRQQYRKVRKCLPVLAPQVNIYNGTQEGTDKHTSTHNENKGKITKLTIGSMNCRGLNHISARQQVIHMMKTHKLDILCVQETHINTHTSTSVTDKQREAAAKAREEQEMSKGRGKRKRSMLELYNLDAEKLGTGLVLSSCLNKHKLDVEQHDNRNITVSLNSNGGQLNITSTPRAGTPYQ